MSHDARDELVHAQAAVVRALCRDEPVPEGFDEHEIIRAREVLSDKKTRIARRRAAKQPAHPTHSARSGLLARLWHALHRVV